MKPPKPTKPAKPANKYRKNTSTADVDTSVDENNRSTTSVIAKVYTYNPFDSFDEDDENYGYSTVGKLNSIIIELLMLNSWETINFRISIKTLN